MQRHNTQRTRLTCAALLLAATGCAAGAVENADTNQPYDDDEVGVSESALGAATRVAGICDITVFDCISDVIDWSASTALVTRRAIGGPNEDVGIVPLTGASGYWAAQSSLVSAVKQDTATGAVYFHRETGSNIIKLGLASPDVVVAHTNGLPKGRIEVDGSYVYWADATGVRKAPKNGGGMPSTLAGGSSNVLLGRDGGELFVRRYNAGIYELRIVATDGSFDNRRHQQTALFDMLSFNATYFFWVDNPATLGSNRIRRLPRAGSAAPYTLAASTGYLRTPRIRGSWVYFGEIRSDATGSHLKRTDGESIENLLTLSGSKVYDVYPGSSELFWDQKRGTAVDLMKATY